MAHYLIYNPSGQIISGIGIDDIINYPIPAGFAAIVSASGDEDGSTFYINAGSITPRPSCPVTAGVAGLTVTCTGCPDGQPYAITGDAVSYGTTDAATMIFVFPSSGNYTLSIACFPAQDFAQVFAL